MMAFSLAVAVTPVLGGNVLINPGFESDPSGQTTDLPGWNAYGGNAYGETSQTVAHSGSNYFKVYQAFNGVVNYTGIYQDFISGPGAVYSANGWAYTLSSDALAGQNIAWIEVTFRDANANILALYRSILITTNSIATRAFQVNTWVNLFVTNQYDLATYAVTNTVSQLVAPAGTYFVRYQIVFQGDANNSGGSMYFDDLNLTQAGGAPYGNWNIVWSDEFNSDSINTNIWTYDFGNGGSGWGNNELEYYTSLTNNAYVANGCLHIVALKQSTNGFDYTSARLKSQGLFSCQYGRVEWRAQLPQGTGCWPALWMLGTNINSIGWPGCGEIDVMENNGSNSLTVQGSLHSGSDETGYYNFIGGDSATNFHTYTLDWTSNALIFYVDGHLYENQTDWFSSTTNLYPYPFNQPFFFLMNMAIGGSYLGSPDTNAINAGTPFPVEMLVDYIRLYNMTMPLQISIAPSRTNIMLAWPGNIVCHLQVQTNTPGTGGIGTNWINVVTTTNSWQIRPTSNAAFYRLESP
ncbi:MAG: family 16 glycosylhydrolase [Limisphaerales bacterium]